MSTVAANANATSKFYPWASWGMIAVVAILAGVLLPQLMPGEMVVDKSPSKAETKDKSSLAYAAPALPEAPNMQAMFARLGAGTVVVLGLCVATLWGMRRWMLPPGAANTTPREMQLRETLQLGNRCCLHLVHLGKQQVLVGVDAAGIKTIVPLPHPFEDVLAEVETNGPLGGALPFERSAA